MILSDEFQKLFTHGKIIQIESHIDEHIETLYNGRTPYFYSGGPKTQTIIIQFVLDDNFIDIEKLEKYRKKDLDDTLK